MAAVACETQATVVYFTSWRAKRSNLTMRLLPRPYRTPRNDVSLIYCEDTSHGSLFFTSLRVTLERDEAISQ